MGLMALIEQALGSKAATDTVATTATNRVLTDPKVATIATVAVATPPGLEIEATREQVKHGERMRLFERNGLESKSANNPAILLTMRDWQLDDRRICAECQNHYGGGCQIHKTPIGGGGPETLHRCVFFR